MLSKSQMAQQDVTFISKHHLRNTLIETDQIQFPLCQLLSESQKKSITLRSRCHRHKFSQGVMRSLDRLNNNENQNNIELAQRIKRNLQPSPSRTSINDHHFRIIQDMFEKENSNLKQHRDFLIGQVRKCTQAIHKYKYRLKANQSKLQQLQHQHELIKLQYTHIKDYVFERINHLQSLTQSNQIATPICNHVLCKYQKCILSNILVQLNWQIEQIKKELKKYEFSSQIRKHNEKETQVYFGRRTKDKSFQFLEEGIKTSHCYKGVNQKYGGAQPQIKTTFSDFHSNLTQKYSPSMPEYCVSKNIQAKTRGIELPKEIGSFQDRLQSQNLRYLANPEETKWAINYQCNPHQHSGQHQQAIVNIKALNSQHQTQMISQEVRQFIHSLNQGQTAGTGLDCEKTYSLTYKKGMDRDLIQKKAQRRSTEQTQGKSNNYFNEVDYF